MIHSNKKITFPFSRNSYLKCLAVLLVLTFLISGMILIMNRTQKDDDQQISHSGYPIVFKVIMMIILNVIFSATGAGIIAWQLEKPLNNFMVHAYEIGRGNFSVKLPSQNNELMQRLAKLIQYMANEMDRLKKINVHGIISEKNKTEALLRNIADGVIVTDMESRVLVINSVIEKWFGSDEKQLIGKPISDCFRNPELHQIFQDIIQGEEEAVSEFEHAIMDAPAKHVLQAHAARVEGESKQPIGVIAVLRDVTQEREADRVKTELVSMVAHELKSPLTSIFGFSELLTQMDPNTSQFREYAHVIMSEATRLTEFVNKFLDLSRLESGRMEVQKNPFDLQQIIQRLIESQKGITEKRHIRVITDFPPAIPLALGDQGLIEQVLLNLFSNAVKYSKDQSKIGIEIKNESDHLLVHVIDNGSGIPKDALPSIFNKFFRVEGDSEEQEIEGSGLGLALVKEIIEKHGGTINVQSRVGVGSIFSFTLPVYQSQNHSETGKNE